MEIWSNNALITAITHCLPKAIIVRCNRQYIFFQVYGYYIRRGGEKTDDKKADEEMTVNAASVTTPISELLLTPDSAVIVDMSGIVQAKAPAV